MLFSYRSTATLKIYFKFNNAFVCFSPCSSKPIKQRVEAFEKLQTPQKETRTRARLLNNDNDVCKN